MTDQPSEEPLISSVESQQLRTNQIDRVPDSMINSSEDLSAFIEEQRQQAINLLRQQAATLTDVELPHERREAILRENEVLIQRIVDEAYRNLSPMIVAIACSELSDLVGFTLEINPDQLDQFGLTNRVTRRETRQGTGFAGYRQEVLLEGDTEEIPSVFETARRSEQMHSFDTPRENIDAVLQNMRPHGTARYEQFSDTGPVLVILPELHYDTGILRNNFDVIMANKDLVALLATEGAEGEVTQERIRQYEGPPGTSSIMIEDIIGSQIYTLGVDRETVVNFAMREVSTRMRNLQESPDLRRQLHERMESLFGDFNITKQDLLEYSSAIMELGDNFFRQIVIQYRNQIWLNEVQSALLTGRERLSSQSNMVFLTCGGGHAEDLRQNARNYGFKGVVTFRPNSLDDPLDMETLRTYAQQQLGSQ